jgi:hypothetical protein
MDPLSLVFHQVTIQACFKRHFFPQIPDTSIVK